MRGPLREAYELFDAIFARNAEDARRLEEFGVSGDKIEVTGDSKADAIIARRDAASDELPGLSALLAIDPEDAVFVAGSTHEGEDEVVLAAYGNLKNILSPRRARLIIAPRHPERAHAVAGLAKMAKNAGRVSLFSELRALCKPSMRGEGEPADIVVVDEIGILYGLYGLAAAAFIGGSLAPMGGQNILEPASWGVPVLHGPYMDDFAEPTRELDETGAAYRVDGAEAMELLWGRAARGELPEVLPSDGYFARQSGAARRSWDRIEKFLL
jgi:3-deoxy-D-manno-octulosonic-acid transferase